MAKNKIANKNELQAFTTMPRANMDRVSRGEEKLNPTPAHFPEWKFPHGVDDKTQVALITKRGSFYSSRNPTYAIEAFLLATQAGLYPPVWVVEWLANGFKKWHSNEGKENLDTILGLRGTGKDPAYPAALKADRDQLVCLDMARLRELGVSISKAAALAVGRLEDKLTNTSKWEVKGYDVERAKQLYRASHWPGVFEKTTTSRYPLRQWKEGQIKAWLSEFRAAELPVALKNRIDGRASAP